MNTPISLPVAKLLKEKGLKLNFYREIFYENPSIEIAEVVMWLYEKHKIWMWVEKGVNPDNFYPVIQNHASFKYSPEHWRDSIVEAYEAGIQYTLKNLI